MSRYDRTPDVDFKGSSVVRGEPYHAPKKDPLEDYLRLAAGIAPLAGTALGAGIGAGVGAGAAGVGAIPGAGVGATIGGAAGGAAGLGLGALADQRSRPKEDAEAERLAREQERAARMQAAMMLAG